MVAIEDGDVEDFLGSVRDHPLEVMLLLLRALAGQLAKYFSDLSRADLPMLLE